MQLLGFLAILGVLLLFTLFVKETFYTDWADAAIVVGFPYFLGLLSKGLYLRFVGYADE